MTTRPPDWPQRLYAFLARKRKEPFAYGVNDCSLFASDWILALTSEDPAADLRGTYRTESEATRILRARGGVAGIAAAYCESKGWPSIGIRHAQRGDLIMIWSARRDALGICAGERSAFASAAGGVQYRRTLDCVQAWRVA